MKNISSLILQIFIFLLFVTLGSYAQTSTPPLGSGTTENPYLIATLNNLYWITQNNDQWDKVYKQTADIDVTTSSSWDGGAGFTPIGNITIQFSGSYDGQTFKIKGLFISRSTEDYIGLFGNGNGATLTNLKLDSVKIIGNNYVGGLIGYQASYVSNITDCYSSGSITGSNQVGGLIGQQYGSAAATNCHSDGSVIGVNYVGGLVGMQFSGCPATNCYSTASVTCSYQYAGGLIGYQYGGSNTTNCYSSGSVIGIDYVGGLIGMENQGASWNCYSVSPVNGSGGLVGGLIGQQRNSSVASNCYSSGSVTGGGSVGGLIGQQYNTCTAKNCYSSSSVIGSSSVGGLIGDQFNSDTVTNCFWDTLSSGQTNSFGGTGKSTAEMKTASTFLTVGWEDTIWNIGDGINNGYPYLKWQNPIGTPLPVELANFTSATRNNSATLIWTTATEMNNYGFEIERRRMNSSQWIKIGFVQGSGTSNAPHEYVFTDVSLVAGCYTYRLKQIDNSGLFKYSQETEVEISAPRIFSLSQNYPDPFNPSTKIDFSIPQKSQVTLKVYDVLGKEVTTLIEGTKDAGTYTTTWNAQNYSSGVYFYRLTAGYFTMTKKLIFLR